MIATVQPRSIARPPVVSPEAWEAARQQMLVEGNGPDPRPRRADRERRRMPWMPVEKAYEFEGPDGKVTDDHLDFWRHRLVGESR